MAFPYFCPNHGYRSDKCCDSAGLASERKPTKANIFPFRWGKVIEVHSIGPYEVVEYDEYKSGFAKDEHGKRLYSGRRLFHIYVDGKDESRSCFTLEGALCFAMAVKMKAERFAPAVAKLLNLDKELV